MKKTLSILFLFIASFGYTQHGEKPDFPTNQLFDLIEQLKTGINSIAQKEKVYRLDRQLSYLYYDLDKYIQLRETLTDYLNKQNYSSFDTILVKEDVSELKVRLKRIGERLNLVKDYLNDELNVEFNMLANDIIKSRSGQWVFIDDLEELSNGEKLNKQKLKIDSEIILQKLKKSLESIIIIRKELKKK